MKESPKVPYTRTVVVEFADGSKVRAKKRLTLANPDNLPTLPESIAKEWRQMYSNSTVPVVNVKFVYRRKK